MDSSDLHRLEPQVKVLAQNSHSPKYCVIGAGAAGLTVCRAFLQHGIPFDCYEREGDVGGIFHYGNPNSSVYRSTHLVSSKKTSEFPDFPMPADYPPCPHHSLVLAYFRSYARHFGLYDNIQFNTGIESIESTTSGWRIQLFNGTEKYYRGVVISNGHHWDPLLPEFAGEFTGEMLHSKQYKTPDIFAGKRVLVVGGGNSACDIASDAVLMANRVFLSIRHPVHFLPKYSFGRPGDVTTQTLIRWGVPLWTLRMLAGLRASVINGRPQDLGLPVPDQRIFDSNVTVSTLVPFHVRQGDIAVKPGVATLAGQVVKFMDGSEEPIDMIVCATGFKVSFPFINLNELNPQNGTPRLFLHQFHPHRDDISVVGLLQSAIGGNWPLMHYQAQLLARYLAAVGQGADLEWFRQLRTQSELDLKGGFEVQGLERHQFTVESVRFERRLKQLIREFETRYGLPKSHPQIASTFTPTANRTVCAVLGIVCGAIAFVLVGLACVPLENLREYGRLIRQPEDVTPERYFRFQQVCWFLAVSSASLAIGLWLAWQGRAVHPEGSNPSAGVPTKTPCPQTREDFHWGGWLALILCVGAGLRLSLIGTPMAYDESYSWINFASRPLPQALGDLNSTNNHLFNTFCMYVTGHLFGPREWVLRMGVMSCGLAALPVTFVWARRWLGTSAALLATAWLAVSSPLVIYSVEARGYMFVMLAAVLLDDAFAKLSDRHRDTALHWTQAGAAVVIGLWSMIIMGYAIIASGLWYLFVGGSRLAPAEMSPVDLPGRLESGSTSFWQRGRQLVRLGWLTAIVASLIYIPGYICRGTLFLNDPVMRQATTTSRAFLIETGQGLAGAVRFCAEGAVPVWVLAGSVLAGLFCWPRDRRSLLRLIIPFVVTVGLNLLRHVNPPPRIYLWLMPWVCLVAAQGVVSLVRSLKAPPRVIHGLVLAVLGLGIWQGVSQWPVLLRSDNRMSYVSVPDVVRRLEREVASAPAESHRLLAPLPCDLPSLFYMDRAGVRIPHNGVPQTGERIWLIARHGETPTEVLQDGLIQLSDWEDRFTPWQWVERYQTLDLYSARVRPIATTGEAK